MVDSRRNARSRTPQVRIAFVVSLLFAALSGLIQAQDTQLTRDEKQLVRGIKDDIDRAGKLFVSKKYDPCVELYNEAKSKMPSAGMDVSSALLIELAPLHAKLVKAQQILAEVGVEVTAPDPLPKDKNAPVSFAADVAPLLVGKCGTCHVNNSRGQFSMATFTSLINSNHIVPGQPVESRLIQVIDTGEMPKDGGKVEAAELDLLRRWVSEGAKCDADQNVNIRTLGPDNQTMAADNRPPAIARATGSESVSFARDIAPLLLENCSGCHIDANRPRANLSLMNIERIFAGGDTGPILKPGSAADSLLTKKLNGTASGARMPVGRDPLPKSAIDLVEKWISEGAKYDGGDTAIPISAVAARSKASRLSHEDLAKDRLEIGKKTWNTFNPGHQFQVVSTNEVQLLGRGRIEQLQTIGESVDAIVANIKKAVRADPNEPLVKGKITVMFVDERYDLDEYGNMILGHELPPTLKSFWKYDQVDAHVVMLIAANDDGSNFEVEMCRNLAAVYHDSLASDVPRWFSDGMAHAVTAKLFTRSEEAASWEGKSMELVRTMPSPDAFIEGSLPEDQAGLIGYYFLTKLRASGARFNKLISGLNSGKGFIESFTNAFGQSPTDFLRAKK